MLRVFLFLVHAYRAVHAVVEQHNNAFRAVLHGSSQLLSVHQKVSIARHRQRHAPSGDRRCYTRWHAIAHGTHGRRQLGFKALGQAVVHEKAVYPAGKVTRAVGQYRVGWQMLLQQAHNGGHVNVAGQVGS